VTCIANGRLLSVYSTCSDEVVEGCDNLKRAVDLGGSTLPPASIPCVCGEKIALPIEALLQGKGATCWNCGARLEVNAEASADAIGALQRLNDRLERIRRDAVS
jgi:hypothetical protein